MTRLEDSEAFVALCDLALVSSGAIHDVPEPSTLVESLDRFVEQGRWPFETPDRAAMDDLSRLPEVAAHVASAWNPWDHA